MTETFDLITVKNAFRLLILVFLFGYAMFSLLLSLRIGILARTLKTDKSTIVAFLAKMHLMMVVIGSVIVGLFIMF